MPRRTMRVRVGEVGLLTVPGELVPELAWGLPEDEAFTAESADVTARGPESVYFPQHDADCNTVDYEECRGKISVGNCDCLAVHAVPYRLSFDETQRPMLDVFTTKYRAVLGATDDYISYIIPEPDFNKTVSLLSANDGDHYEDTVSPAFDFASIIQQGQAGLGQ